MHGASEFPVPVILVDSGYEPLTCGKGSPDWTRTSNPAINSRMLCQLSYGGPAACCDGTSGYPIVSTVADARVGSR